MRHLQQVGIPILFAYVADLMTKMDTSWLRISSGLLIEIG